MSTPSLVLEDLQASAVACCGPSKISGLSALGGIFEKVSGLVSLRPFECFIIKPRLKRPLPGASPFPRSHVHSGHGYAFLPCFLKALSRQAHICYAASIFCVSRYKLRLTKSPLSLPPRRLLLPTTRTRSFNGQIKN
jgi:hypothetical protein